MTGRMLEGIESLIEREAPDWVLVYGDTNSTLAGALAAVKRHVPVAHVEAGLRSRNAAMPEEINRVLTDRISTWLLCPTETAVANLQAEGFPHPTPDGSMQRIADVGDVMYDAVLFYRDRARREISLDRWRLAENGYALCTIHRQENTDDPQRLTQIVAALQEINRQLPVVLPLHPRPRQRLDQQNLLPALQDLTCLDPLPYLAMQRLEMSARVILTDSGGIQKEAYFHQVPCVTLRDESEWLETVELGWNQVVGADTAAIAAAFENADRPGESEAEPYGAGWAAWDVLDRISDGRIRNFADG